MCASHNHLFGKVTSGRIRPFVCVDVPSGSESEHGMEWSVLDSGMEVSIEDVLSGRKEPECDESSIELNTYPVVEE